VDIQIETLRLEFNQSTLKLSGKLAFEKPQDKVGPHLTSAHDTVVEQGTGLTLDLSDLEFVNSSGIMVIMNCVQLLKSLPDEKKYRLLIVYSHKHPWQRSRFVHTLQMFAPNHVEIREA